MAVSKTEQWIDWALHKSEGLPLVGERIAEYRQERAWSRPGAVEDHTEWMTNAVRENDRLDRLNGNPGDQDLSVDHPRDLGKEPNPNLTRSEYYYDEVDRVNRHEDTPDQRQMREPMPEQEPDYQAMSERSLRKMPDWIAAAIDRKESAEDWERDFRDAWKEIAKKHEPGQIEDQRQTNLWTQTMEVGRQTRQEAPQQESPQEQENQRRQLSL